MPYGALRESPSHSGLSNWTEFMRIEIVNERLLPRFGVDRLLILLAKHLVAQGHEVGFTCLHCDPRLPEGIGEVITLTIPPGLDMAATEYEVARLMRRRLEERKPDAVVSGGWPFFRTTRECGERGIASLFIDAGATAQDGMTGPALVMQRELRRVRQMELPGTDRILPISHFICRSQTFPDRGQKAGVRTVLLGSNHMDNALFPSGDQDPSGEALLARLQMLKDAGSPLILALGRFETSGYKNSVAAYDVLRRVRLSVPQVRLLILDAGVDCLIPPDLASSVILLGQPDDATLRAVMEICEVGLSPSLWEGFNFPIVEMQHLKRPALAFALGAHPEVIAHPWLLCDSVEDMIRKTIRILTDLAPTELMTALERSHHKFPWQRTLTQWEEEILSAVAHHRSGKPEDDPAPRIILADVTNASIDPANSGVMRVTRQLFSCLQKQENLKLVFVRWDSCAHTYRLLNGDQRKALACYGGPVDRLSLLAEAQSLDLEEMLRMIRTGTKPPVLFTPEVILDGAGMERLAWARGRNMMTSAILHDLIPIEHPGYCDRHVIAAFPAYLSALLQYDHIWSVSDYSDSCLKNWTSRHNLPLRATIRTLWLAGQFGSSARITTPPKRLNSEIRVLCVSTLEPRKNHVSLLAAWRRLRRHRPDLKIRLTLVGNHYAGAPGIFEAIQDAVDEDSSIEYKGVLSDQDLLDTYEACDFTIYPSLVEGFGLPILESLWLGRPCITHKAGVMAELASSGACLSADMQDPEQIENVLERLATDAELLSQMTEKSSTRKISTWRDYAIQIGYDLSCLKTREKTIA